MTDSNKLRAAKPQPHKIKSGNTTLRIYAGKYRQKCNGELRTYDQFTVVHFDGTGRKRKTFSTLDSAKEWAKTRAEMIDQGRRDAAKIGDADAESFALAMRTLKPLGIPLNVAIAEFVHARLKLPAGVTLDVAAADYAERHKSMIGTKNVPEVVAEFLAMRKQEIAKGRASLRDVQTVRSHLNRFAAYALTPIHLVETRAVVGWLRDNADAPKSWNNMRASLVRLFKFAQEQGYIAKAERTAADLTKRMKLGDSDIATLPPATLQKLLGAADEEARLYLSLAAFTGLRTAELLRLKWEHLDFAANVIRLPKTVTKTARRRAVPILPNLRAWLEPHRGAKGDVFTSEKASDRTIAFVKEQGMEWPDNWARHSFGSYRAVLTQSVGQVAMELGNTETIVKRHYFDAFASEADAKAWFAIIPPEQPGNVIPMKGAA